MEAASGQVDVIEIAPELVAEPAGQALLEAGLAGVLGQLQARCCVAVLQVMVTLENETYPALLLAGSGPSQERFFHAPIKTDPSGRLSLGAWRQTAGIDSDWLMAIRRTLVPRED